MRTCKTGGTPTGKSNGISARLVILCVAALLFAVLFYGHRTSLFARAIAAQSPADEQKSFRLPPGYHLELALSEPEVIEPVLCVFDGNGRMFVAEMRSYMQNIDAKDETAPVSRVSMHWSSKGDGVYDKHTVFADHLLLPRMVLPLGDGQVVIGETNTTDLYLYTDTNGDGVSDKKELWFRGALRGSNVEVQPSGLIWALDNGIYTTLTNYRLRWTPQGVVQEPVSPAFGQWGASQDDHGKIYFTNAGGERGPVSFQQPVVYGAFNPNEQFAPGFEEVWPLVGIADAEGGPRRSRPTEGTLNHFTSCSAPQIYRGDRLPAELRGDLFFGEPVGRLVRQAKVETDGCLTVLRNPYQEQKSEFLRSTDPCFRPVNLTTSPDGKLYLTDMYRGIIQEGGWVREGSYLRKVVQRYALDKVVGHGRIWRLIHDGMPPGPEPKMYQETSLQLVEHLRHPNGWWRDTAQKLLILRQDQSVVPSLEQMVRTDSNELARIHALWTLEGLGALSPVLVREALHDPLPQLRVAAIRVSESIAAKGDGSLKDDVKRLAKDADPNVAIQSLLTAKLLKWPEAEQFIRETLAASQNRGVKEIGNALTTEGTRLPSRAFTAEQSAVLQQGAEIFTSLCATCHGIDGRGLPMAGAEHGARLAPALADSKTINGPEEGAIGVLLHGLTGEINARSYGGTMVSMAANDDAWIAAVLSYVRNAFANHGSFVTAEEVAQMRAATKGRAVPWSMPDLMSYVPQRLPNRKKWQITASDPSGDCRAAIDGDTNTNYSMTSQTPGQWVQIELPHETLVAGVTLDCVRSPNDFPREYKVELSGNGQDWGTPVATENGDGPITESRFTPKKARFIRVTLTSAAADVPWSIFELQIYAPAARH